MKSTGIILALVGALLSDDVRAQSKEQRPSNGVSFKVGPFSPEVSDDAAQLDFYGVIFSRTQEEDGVERFVSGLSRPQPLYTLDIESYLLNDYGLLGITTSVGFWSISGRTRVCPEASDGSTCDPNAPPGSPANAIDSSTEGNETARLTLIPVAVGVVYKWDELKRKTRYLPFVPYIKTGISYTYWRSTSGGDGTRRRAQNAEGQSVTLFRGRGAQLGIFATAGLALNLDWIEPRSKRSAGSVDITDTSIFFEGSYSRNDGFENGHLDFSDIYWQAGLSVDFE